MSDNIPQYEYEAWLLPYKPRDQTKGCNFELNCPKSNITRDSKNRRILTLKELYEYSEQDSYDYLKDKNIPSHKNDTERNTFPDPPVSASVSSPHCTSSTVIPGFVPPGVSSDSNNGRPKSQKYRKNKETKRTGAERKLNVMQQRFEKAEPVNTPKAMSMMLKMGWSGGGLGRTEEGIKDPIVPILDYAVQTKGFGKPEPPKIKNPPKRQTKAERRALHNKDPAVVAARQKRKDKKTLFHQNVLRCILDFVTNESEIAVLFDKALKNGNRKVIHRIVEEIRNLWELEVEANMNEGYERVLMMTIVKKNRYVLQTQSEGDMRHRALCLFKEAPESMYLVTHFELNGHETDFLKKEDIFTYRYTANSKKERGLGNFLRKHAINKEYEIIQESPDSFVCRVYVEREINKSQNETFNTDKCINEHIKIETIDVSGESDDEKYCESDDDDEIYDGDCDGSKKTDKYTKVDESNHTQIIKTESKTEIEEGTAIGSCSIKKDGELLEMYTDITKSEKKNNSVENINKTFKTSMDNSDENIKMEVAQQEFEIKLEPDANIENCSNNYLRHNLNLCFSDFIAGEEFREFKFLGDFNEEEFIVMNEFLKDFFLVKSGYPALDEEFMGVWKAAQCKLAYKRDINGGIVIYKVT